MPKAGVRCRLSLHSPQDASKRAFDVLLDGPRRDSKNPEAPVAKFVVAQGIVLHLSQVLMGQPIHLDDKARLRTVEVRDISPQGVLAAESVTRKPALPESFPEKPLGVGTCLSQSAAQLVDVTRYDCDLWA
jgi:hypothetical protein